MLFRQQVLKRVFKMMLSQKKHMAVVLDEYGGTLGIVTQEDIIEEMIGQDIEDETDMEEEVLIYEKTDDSLTCHGRLEIIDAMELLGIELPTDHETIGGFVLQQLGHLPEPGERFSYENLRFEIEEMERNRIIRMTISTAERLTINFQPYKFVRLLKENTMVETVFIADNKSNSKKTGALHR